MPFGAVMSTTHPGDNTSSAMNDVQRKLAALTLRLEKELETEATVGEYYGQCTKCGESVTGSSDACQAMGELYHNDCFKCVVCSRTLRGKAFYRVQNQVYCEEDYLVRTN
jgi:LIM domain-containing protein